MSDVVLIFVVSGLFLVFAFFCFFADFYSDYDLVMVGVAFCLLSVIVVVSFLGVSTPCPNPDCKEWVQSSYCQKCGCAVNVPIDCPTCENKFDADNVPDFCPDCGSNMKAGEG